MNKGKKEPGNPAERKEPPNRAQGKGGEEHPDHSKKVIPTMGNQIDQYLRKGIHLT